MLRLLSLLQVRSDWAGSTLAARLDVSDRTLRRDVDRLRELGYRIVSLKGPGGGYRLEAGEELPPLRFDDEQAVAIATALQSAAATGAADAEAALRALTTVRQVLPSRLRHRVDGLAFTAMRSASAVGVDAEVLVAVAAAVRAHEVLRLDHAAVGASPTRRRVEPHDVVFTDGRWYLVAWDLERDDWRILRLDRVVPHAPTGPRFSPRALPDGDARALVAARFKGSTSGDRWPCEGTVVLAARAVDVAPFVADGAVEPLGDDRCRVSIGAWSWIALAASIGRFDAAVVDARPRELAEAFATLARRYADAAEASARRR